MSLEPIILNELQRGGPPLWVADRTYRAGQCVLSPSDWQVYVRTAPGVGAADPQDDTAHWVRWGASVEAAVAQLSTAVDVVSDGLYEVAAMTTAIGSAVAGLNALWAPGRVVKQGEAVLSPLDWETYRRTAATGSGNTDPANDVANYVATSFERCSAMAPRATSSTTGGVVGAQNYANGVTRTVPGALAVGARTAVLSLTGRGALSFLGIYFHNTATMRVEVIVDGRTVYDQSLVAASYNNCTLLGQTSKLDNSNDYYAIVDANGVQFRRQLQVFFTVQSGSWNANCAVAHSFRGIA